MKTWTLVEKTLTDRQNEPHKAASLFASDGFYTMHPIMHSDGALLWDRYVPIKVQARTRAAMNRARREGRKYHNDCRA